MSTTLSKPTTAPKRRAPKKAVTPKKTTRSRKPSSKPARSKVKISVVPVEAGPDINAPVPITAGTRLFLGREGVAFGPYTEFQLRESVRLGIFEHDDLVLPENGNEWSELSTLFPDTKPAKRPVVFVPSSAPQEVKLTLPNYVPEKSFPPARRAPGPLSEHHLREHAESFAETPSTSLGSRLTDRRFALAAIPGAVVVLCLVLLATVARHHEPIPRAIARPAMTEAQPATASQPKAAEPVETGKLAANVSGVRR